MSIQRVISIWRYSVAILVVITFGVAGYLSITYPDVASRPEWVDVLKGLIVGVCIIPWGLAFFAAPYLNKVFSPVRGVSYIVRAIISVVIGAGLFAFAIFMIVGGIGFFAKAP